ncbi:hypothetical protein TUM20983_37910 [Mycobacterium antarcticum]|nr:hypothetical protein TUM20983_37910 [Mycolicibacterium sp. TUM20983]
MWIRRAYAGSTATDTALAGWQRCVAIAVFLRPAPKAALKDGIRICPAPEVGAPVRPLQQKSARRRQLGRSHRLSSKRTPSICLPGYDGRTSSAQYRQRPVLEW